MKYYIIAGERSGDLHASNLIREIKKADKKADFRAWGGDMMKMQGAILVKHINELAFMGFVEVAKNLSTILSNIRFCKNDILQYNPDAVIFIDYPGFNLRIAEFCKKNNIRTIYYISPQVWAWHQSRVKKIKRDVDLMLVILPFEEAFYKKHNFDTIFVGHPLLDALDNHTQNDQLPDFRKANGLSEKPIIALLPGSRAQEIRRMLQVMTSVSTSFPEYQFVIAGIQAHNEAFYKKYTSTLNIPIVFEQTYDLLNHSEAALVTSGTATLETAIIGTPQIVCYKAGNISYQIARRLVDLKYISLVNLIMDKMVVKEMIQKDLNEKNLVAELKNILLNASYRKAMLENYSKLREKLGGKGASEKAAKTVVEFLKG